MRGKQFAWLAAASLLVALAAATGARTGGDLTPEQRRAAEQQAEKLNGQGIALFRQGKYPEATVALEKALALCRRLYVKDHHRLVIALSNLATVLKTRGDLDPAERHYRDALAMCRRLYRNDHPYLANGLNNMGAVLRERGDLDGAEKFLGDALAMQRRLHRKDHQDLASSLNSLGVLLMAQGDPSAAERYLREARAMLQRLHPKGHPTVAQILTTLGTLLRHRGDLGEAEKNYRDALTMRRRLYPGDHHEVAASLNHLGGVLSDRGELEEAGRNYVEALAMYRRLYPGDHPETAASLNNLGLVRRLRKDMEGAERLLREALDMDRRLYPRDHRNLATGLDNLGGLLHDRGDLGGAEKHYAEALAMYRRLYPKDHPDLAFSLNNLGLFLWERGDLDKAERRCGEALAMRRRLYPDGHLVLATSLSSLGVVRQARGDLEGAEKHHTEALAMQQRFLIKEARLLAEADALNFVVTLVPTPSRDLLLSSTLGRPGTAAYDLLWQGRSALTRLVEQRHRDLLASRDPEARDLGVQLLSARQRLARRLFAPVTDALQNAEEIRKLTEAKEALEKELARKLSLELPAVDPVPPPPRRLAERLPAGVAFLDFYRYLHFEFDPQVKGKKSERRTTLRYVAFLLTGGQPVVRIELGGAGPVERAWAAWREAITNKEASPAQERRAAAALAKLVWKPIQMKLPAGVHTLYLAPDVALTQVPWAALPGRKPNTVLLEEYTFATVPHGPFLLDRLSAKGKGRPAGDALLAVGGVDYHQAADPVEGGPARRDLELDTAPGKGPAALPAKDRLAWQALPGTERELERVAALAHKPAGLKVCPLTGKVATTTRVLAELPQARYAHLATHGFFADAQIRSAFVGGPDLFARLTPDRRGGARSPLVLSGLVFAGANRTGKEAEADRGILTAEGIVGLRLDKLELAVLSACDTGLGEVAGGEGVFGLQRAFHVAGARNVVASLWNVNDEATAALMHQFYHNLWERKLDPLQALREAQLDLYHHPERIAEWAARSFPVKKAKMAPPPPPVGAERAPTRLWAAFILSGDGR
jgi:CHAT domain-containing protein/Tfp pilus assembly protein PilF